MAHLLEHMLFKGTPNHPNIPQELTAHGARPERLDLVRPHQLLRDLPGDRREPRVGARPRSRPDGQLVHRQEGPRQRDDGRAQRVRARRERPGRDPRGARPLDGVPLAQLRQVHDRRAVRHRERADRPAAGVLPEVLPARQRGARRRRQVRRGEDARAGRPDLRRDPEADARAADLLHARADAGRRAQRSRSPRRRRPGARRGVPRPVGHGSRRPAPSTSSSRS